MTPRRIDELLDTSYVDDLEGRPITEIRAKREELQRAEVGLSYLRRLVQGRLDIVAAEIHRRAEGFDSADIADLVAKLPEILGAKVMAPSPNAGRLLAYMAPSDHDDEELTAELDDVLDSGSLARLSDADHAELSSLADQLAELERSVSDRRRALHDRIDLLQAELVRRYKTGEATVESLLR